MAMAAWGSLRAAVPANGTEDWNIQMKKVFLALFCLALSGGANAEELIPEDGREVMVLAHRACWEGGAPEVSVAAIRACDAINPEMIEIDVLATRDGALVLMHDDTVDRTTNGTGRVADMTLDQIRTLRLRAGEGGPDAALTDERIPTLEEALLAAKDRYIVNLHFKAPLEQEAAEVVKRLGMAGQVTAWVSGQPGEIASLMDSPMRGVIGLIPVIDECKGAKTESCWSRPIGSFDAFTPLQPVAFYMLEGTAPGFIADGARARRPTGSRIMARSLWTIDNLPHHERRTAWRGLIDAGVEIIMTDRPGDLIDLLNDKDG